MNRIKFLCIFTVVLICTSCSKQTGIDVSHHNHLTEKDWNDLQNKEHISFVYAKFSEGGTYKDPTRFKYAKIAKERNLKFGAYHFFRDDVSANKQCDNFNEAMDEVTRKYPVNLMTVIDFEAKGLHKNIPDSVRYSRLKELYCLEAHACGREIVIYCNLNHYRKLRSVLPDAIYWVRYYPFATMTQVTKNFNGKELDFNYISTMDFYSKVYQ